MKIVTKYYHIQQLIKTGLVNCLNFKSELDEKFVGYIAEGLSKDMTDAIFNSLDIKKFEDEK